jgi:hypothetical protein
MPANFHVTPPLMRCGSQSRAGVISRAPIDQHAQSFGMREIPVAAFAAPVHKTGFFQVGDQLSHFARHQYQNSITGVCPFQPGGTTCKITTVSE